MPRGAEHFTKMEKCSRARSVLLSRASVCRNYSAPEKLTQCRVAPGSHLDDDADEPSPLSGFPNGKPDADDPDVVARGDGQEDDANPQLSHLGKLMAKTMPTSRTRNAMAPPEC
jgi:hypothetical protein